MVLLRFFVRFYVDSLKCMLLGYSFSNHYFIFHQIDVNGNYWLSMSHRNHKVSICFLDLRLTMIEGENMGIANSYGISVKVFTFVIIVALRFFQFSGRNSTGYLVASWLLI